MKTILLLLLFPLACFGQETITFPKNTPLQHIVTTLFDGTLNNATGECEWIPNTGERFQFWATKGQLLYTVVDTTFTYSTARQLIIATSTYTKDEKGQREDCHICSPALSLIVLEEVEDGTYTVAEFNKFVANHGGWGEPGAVSLIEIAEFVPLIVIDHGYTGQGATYTYQSFYYKGLPMLDLTTHIDNEGATEDVKQQYSFDTTMTVDSTNGTLTFNRRGTEPNAKGKIVKVNQTTTYRYNPEEATLEKLCN